MGVRSELVRNLFRYLPGPTHGPDEVLPEDRDPRDEYVCGVLAPFRPEGKAAAYEIEAEADALDGGIGDEDDEEEVSAPPAFSPALDPRSQPSSIGISFVLRLGAAPKLHLCVTAARYERGAGGWKRRPFGWAGILDPSVRSQECRLDDAVRVTVRSTPSPGDLTRVSVYLTNQADPGDPEKAPPTPSLLFQPQLRISIEGARTVSLGEAEAARLGEAGHPEEDSLRLLYLDRPVMARGHLCGAVWREIDPEHPLDPEGPFQWIDRDACPELERKRFQHPDYRTEFLPAIAVAAPSTAWNGKYGEAPVLDADSLSTTWDAGALDAVLRPLCRGYERWIAARADEVAGLPQALKQTATRHLDLCRESLARMEGGIDLLEKDEKVRLAFAFANRAVAFQASWPVTAERGPFVWHPFQMGFILQCLQGIADPQHPDRNVCDLLWFPTGGGKTEAYLGLTAFTLALRRLEAPRSRSGLPAATGTGVLTRYTLRLLTIQQFRRALKLILACELLRNQSQKGGPVGWRPPGCPEGGDWLWGGERFSAGLWVGGGVTPNRLTGSVFMNNPGALEVLRGEADRSDAGEPAQVLECPACEAILAVPQTPGGRQERPAFPPGKTIDLHLIVTSDEPLSCPAPGQLGTEHVRVLKAGLSPLPAPGSFVLSVQLEAGEEGITSGDLDEWWKKAVKPRLGDWPRLEPARASRPGYFIRTFPNARKGETDWTFEVYCPNPRCPSARAPWRERVPVSIGSSSATGNDEWQHVHPAFQAGHDPTVGTRSPIPALTVDDQVYAWPPSLLVGTVDKFARLAFEPRAAALFGNVERYHARDGYYRRGCPRDAGSDPAEPKVPRLSRDVAPLPPPQLVLQDELHLLDGPLGSMVGLYETAVEVLCSTKGVRPKYLASTATVREASDQVRALFCRDLRQFPSPGLSASDSFFAFTPAAHPLEEEKAGRLYIGYCPPGKGAQTPIVRLWAVLLQTMEWLNRQGVDKDALDPYWTLIGYFNALRELAGASGLYRQDIPQRMEHLAALERRVLSETPMELSSRVDSVLLPALLTRLGEGYPKSDPPDAALATSMFGTGVDITRLSLMAVHGQPKTTSSYIQATGRVGRRKGGLVVTYLRASRARDLDHYEFFTGYHSQLYRGVEPVTVFPYSPRARDRALGPLCAALLRNAENLDGSSVHGDWRLNTSGSRRMAVARTTAEPLALPGLFEERAGTQPDGRRPDPGRVGQEVRSALDRWQQLAQYRSDVRYVEYALKDPPVHPVVLGDAQHIQRNLDVAYPNAPQSLREVEPTTGFQT